MLINDGFDNVKKVGLLTLLLMQAMFAPAQASDNVAEAEASGSEQQRAYPFPRWSEPRKLDREKIPPSPPGPYMSTALSGSSINGPSFESDDKPVVQFGSSSRPMEAFSPDIPWPSNSKSSDRWQPEGGYHYVKPAVNRPAMAKHMPANYNYGYTAPAMGGMSGSGAAVMPYGQSSGMNPNNRSGVARSGSAGADAYMPNSRPQNSGYRSSRPVMNNSAMQSRQHANRAPYPASGRP